MLADYFLWFGRYDDSFTDIDAVVPISLTLLSYSPNPNENQAMIEIGKINSIQQSQIHTVDAYITTLYSNMTKK